MAHRKVVSRKNPLLPASLTEFLVRSAWRLWGLALIVTFAVFIAALWSYDRLDPNFNLATDRSPSNLLGSFGSHAADLLLQPLGLAAIVLILPLLSWGWLIASLRGIPKLWSHLLLLPFAVMATTMFADSIPADGDWPLETGYGGVLGQMLIRQSYELFGLVDINPPLWTFSLGFGILALAGVTLTLGVTALQWGTFFRSIGRGLGKVFGGLKSMRPTREARQVDVRRGISKAPETQKKTKRQEPTLERGARRDKAKSGGGLMGADKPPRRRGRISTRKKTQESDRVEREAQVSLNLGDGDFRLPRLDLLEKPSKVKAAEVSGEALEQNAKVLESVLDDFGIKGEIKTVRPGPVVTLYELEPAPGTKSSRVIGLADDIARSMSARSARVAVVPGRNAIGIELPNSAREMVMLEEQLSSRDFDRTRAALPLALGKDISGAPVISDLATLPHLLVAGTTGAGKSVAINAMVLSLLYRLPPDRCRFILVDPKMLELSVYDGIPHLLTPVVTEPKKAVVALKWAVREMEERYRAMSKLGVRNIAAYNKRVEEARANNETLKRRVQTGFDKESGQPVYEEQEFDFEALPLIVIVIDEMADLMLVAGKDVEALVQRLAQMARAAGLHVIMATQRPSVDVITGTIKANFPARIAFQVTSKIDSRTILGDQGAEQLLGKGDMLYMPGGSRVSRVHGAFVSDEEVERVVSYLKTQGVPEYLEEVTEEPAEGFDSPFIPGGSESSGNELYDKAVDVVLRDRKASTSYIQRRLKIGYNRAATLIEEMEDNGIVSAPNHAGKREILVPGEGETI